jgi:hypothetical protein
MPKHLGVCFAAILISATSLWADSVAISFVARRDAAAGTNPHGAVAADINGDGKIDIVVTNSSANSISVLLRSPNGAIQDPISKAVGSQPQGLAAGDFNRDGKLDIVTANAGASNVSFLAGRGDGTFQDAVSYAAGTHPYSVAAGDFNGDGKLDLATANYGAATVSILLGNGDGTFKSAVDFPTGNNPAFVAVGDLNGDGKADLAVANAGSNSVSVLLGDGMGSFQPLASVAVGTNPTCVAIADINKDGKLDLITSNYGSNNISVAAGAGNGAFIGAVNTSVGSAPYAVAGGDLSGDGAADIVVANSGSSTISVLVSGAGGSLGAPVSYATGASPRGVTLADVYGDGKLSAIVTASSSSVVSVFRGKGDGTFQAGGFAASPYLTESGTVGDFNGDGKPDVAFLTSSIVQFAYGRGDGSFQTPFSISLATYPMAITAGDFNGDGKADFAVASDAGNLAIYFGNGNGTFQLPVSYPLTLQRAYSVDVTDLNNDGNADLIASDEGGTVYVLLGNGKGTFQTLISALLNGAPVMGDFNGDGKVDIASIRNGALTQAVGNGNGTFQGLVPVTGLSGGTSLAAGDFNGDGKTDAVVASPSGAYLLLGSSSGIVGPAKALTTLSGYSYVRVLAGDFNGDGNTDVAFRVTNPDGLPGVAVYAGLGNGNFDGPALYGPAGLDWFIKGDMNGDGRPDILSAGGSSVGYGINVLMNDTPAYVTNVVTSSPAGRNFTADGQTYTAPQTFSWIVGSGHTVSWATPQTAGTTQYTFTGWLDGSAANPRTIVVGAVGGTYTANFSSASLCTYALSGTTSLPAAGGTGTVNVTAPAGCAWSASSDSSWLIITSGNGTGSGTVAYSATANATQAARTAQVSAGGVSYGITQAAAVACSYVIAGNAALPAAGGSGTLTVTAASGCAWTAISNSSWLTITSGSGTGGGTITYNASANSSQAARTAQVSAGGVSYSITQAGAAACLYTFSQTSFSFSSSGGSGSVTVSSSGSNCSWTAVSNSSWISITSTAGNSVSFAVQASDGAARAGTLTVAGQTITVSQSGTCSISLGGLPNADAGGGTGALTVNAATGCEWRVSTSAPWALVYPSSGTGPAQVTWVIQPNKSTASRSLTITSGTSTATVTQPGRTFCSVAPAPSGYTVGYSGGSYAIAVTTDASCTYGITSNADWLKVYGTQTSFTGSVTVFIIVSANTASTARFGTMSIGDQTLPVTQSASYQTPGTRFVPVTPCRVADTRFGQGKSGPFGPSYISGSSGQPRDIPIPLSGCNVPGTARAYSLNITVLPYGPLGYLTAWPQGQTMPVASNLNAPTGTVAANAAIVPAGTGGGISIYASDPTEVIVDINGYFVGTDTTSALAFYPVTPCRVMDTRAGQGTTDAFGPPTMPTGGTTRVVPVPSSRCPIPTTAAAYSVNFTVVPTGKLGYLSAWPTGQAQPVVSTLNSWDGSVLANAAIVPAGTGGSISVFTWLEGGATTDVIMDINGYFAPPGTGGLSFYPVTPCRAVDTRATEGKSGAFGPPSFAAGGTSRSFPIPTSSCSVPSSAQAYAMNVTAVPTGYLAYLSIWPTGVAQPVVSTLNSWDGRIVANAALVPGGTNGAVSVFTYVGTGAKTDVVLDVSGYFAP